MIYACPAGAFVSKFNMNRLQNVQNRALSIVGGNNWFTRMAELHIVNEITMLRSFTTTVSSCKIY